MSPTRFGKPSSLLILIVLPAAAAALVGCGKGSGTGGVHEAALCPAGRLVPLVDRPEVYADDSPALLSIDLTVGDVAALERVNHDVPDATAPVRFREGSFAADVSGPNGTIELRGSTSREALQKSYQIKLTSMTDLWRGQKVINLLKHPYDLTRARQRLSYDIFKTIPNFVSLRSQFAHVVLNGEDMGLFEWVEEPDKRYLAAHGLDVNGTIYKSKTFSFGPIDAKTAGNKAAMDALASVMANGDQPKLIAMVDAVNDPTRDIDDVIATHFNRDNYLSWLAVNLLFADFDTGSQNFMLYSPKGCDGWYFMPWDYDGAWGWYEQPGNPPRPRWRAGLANWWWVPLHQRFLAKAQNRQDLEATMARIMSDGLSDATSQRLLAGYHDIIKPFVASAPDNWNLPTPSAGSDAAVADWDTEIARVGGLLSQNYAEYQRVRLRPMPFWLYQAVPGDPVVFSWEESFDVAGDGVSYRFQVATDVSFDADHLLVDQPGLKAPLASAPHLPSGNYFWRVIAQRDANPGDDWSYSFQGASPLNL